MDIKYYIITGREWGKKTKRRFKCLIIWNTVLHSAFLLGQIWLSNKRDSRITTTTAINFLRKRINNSCGAASHSILFARCWCAGIVIAHNGQHWRCYTSLYFVQCRHVWMWVRVCVDGCIELIEWEKRRLCLQNDRGSLGWWQGRVP